MRRTKESPRRVKRAKKERAEKRARPILAGRLAARKAKLTKVARKKKLARIAVTPPKLRMQPQPSGRTSPARAKFATPAALTFSPGLQQVIESRAELAKCTRYLADNVAFTVTTTTVSGEPIQSARGRLAEAKLDYFRPIEQKRDLALDRLAKLGFTILRRGRFATTVVGPAKLVTDVLKEPLMVMRQVEKAPIRSTHAFAAETDAPDPRQLFLAPTSSLTVRPTALGSGIDHFVFAPPALLFMPPSITPPALAYHHLGPADLRQILNVPTAGPAATLNGRGSKVGIVDTGFGVSHPFYSSSGVDFTAHASPGGLPGGQDAYGHGTAVASNVFAVAPRVEMHGVRQANPPYGDAVEQSFEDHGVDILTCSWGWDREQSFPTLEATLRSFIEEGKIVLFSSGNGHYAWPGSMPDVISIGGVFSDAARQLEASNYASGFMSSLYPGRQTPDVCGLCGQVPLGIYIPMPCPEGCEMDHRYAAGGTFPNGDETAGADGWVVASGTSSAAPQIAGVLALLLQAMRAKGTVLTNPIAKDLLQQTARNVSRGHNAFGFPGTTAQPNGAVGFGLVNVTALLDLARTRNLI